MVHAVTAATVGTTSIAASTGTRTAGIPGIAKRKFLAAESRSFSSKLINDSTVESPSVLRCVNCAGESPIWGLFMKKFWFS